MLYSTNFYALSEYILNEENLFMAFCYDILHYLNCPGFEKKKFQELIKDFIQNQFPNYLFLEFFLIYQVHIVKLYVAFVHIKFVVSYYINMLSFPKRRLLYASLSYYCINN